MIEKIMRRYLTFKGNVMGSMEKMLRLKVLRYLIRMGKAVSDPLDEEFIPYLCVMNQFSIMTTQCCTGHNENPKTGRRAYFSFRSVLSIEDTIDFLLRPLQDKYVEIDISLCTECNQLRYCIWLSNKKWKEQVEFFMGLLTELPNNYKLELQAEIDRMENMLKLLLDPFKSIKKADEEGW